MMMTVAEQLNPAGELHTVWDPQVDGVGHTSPSEITGIIDTYNMFTLPDHLKRIKSTAAIAIDETTGIHHATFKEPGDSNESILVHGHPFSCDMNDNMLLRADFIYKSMKAMGIRDQSGRTLPLITLAKPGPNSTMRFSSSIIDNRIILEHHISDGDFGPAGELTLDVVRRTHPQVGRLGRLAFSLDACIAPTEATLAREMSLDMTHLVVGDPVNVVERSLRQLLTAFAPEAKLMPDNLKRAGIDAFIDVHKSDSALMFMKNVLCRARTNLALYKGMATDTFVADLSSAARTGTVITVGATSDGKVAPKEAVFGAVNAAREVTGEKIYTVLIGNDRPETHCVGDQLNVLSTFYAYGLSLSRVL